MQGMYHCFKLIRHKTKAGNELVCDHNKAPHQKEQEHITSETKRKFFVLGLLESIPLLSGMIASAFHHIYFEGDLVVAGAIITLLIIYILKHKTPATPISFKTGI